MKTVFKYAVDDRLKVIELPADFKITSVHCQNRYVHFWAEVDTEQPKIQKTFAIVGTGQEIPKDFVHVGTAHDSPFVWHLYMK